MSVIADVYLLLGANLGNRTALLNQAIEEIAQEIGQIVKASAVYETAAWGDKSQPNYLNQVLRVTTSLQPLQLLEKINAIEKKLGRERMVKWEARLIDIDILLYSDQVIDKPNLQVPHPHLPNRRFALVPLQEIAPFLIHPVAKRTVTELLNDTPDRLPVQYYETKASI
ncbi:2-amino-4-hydroxy-6-hydroxymethyldihydropteridine diphosphokinase [Parapedobacter deserti]|uniref:2-amino-4-hydroxy-6-hydroxymethyldihydropteridine pyrophosphokinase n=1 Tax=Parapedobacter deserti TaxID=1912957 RepID=A0ABV7JVD9_9SPHI